VCFSYKLIHESMKKLMFFFLLMISAGILAQTKKPITEGSIIISGGGSIASYKTDNINGNTITTSSSFSMNIAPGAGYFIADNLAIGANLGISYFKQSGNKYYSLGIGPFLKYYFQNGIFLKAETNFTMLHGLGSNDSRQKGYSISPGAGYAFFLNDKVSLEPAFVYSFNHYNYAAGLNDRRRSVMLEARLCIFL
jgi:hypothetical protein